MTEPNTTDPVMPSSELADTGGKLDTAHDPAESDGPHLAAAAEERAPGDAGGLTDGDR